MLMLVYCWGIHHTPQRKKKKKKKTLLPPPEDRYERRNLLIFFSYRGYLLGECVELWRIFKLKKGVFEIILIFWKTNSPQEKKARLASAPTPQIWEKKNTGWHQALSLAAKQGSRNLDRSSTKKWRGSESVDRSRVCKIWTGVQRESAMRSQRQQEGLRNLD